MKKMVVLAKRMGAHFVRAYSGKEKAWRDKGRKLELIYKCS